MKRRATPPTRRPAAATRAARPAGRLRTYALRHAEVLVSSLGRLYRSPLSTFMTAAVIGIALALPGGMLTLLTNLQRLGSGWDGSAATISVFLKTDQDDAAAAALARQVGGWPQVARVRTITREQALAEFRHLSGFGAALDALQDNPLPAVLVVTPGLGHTDTAGIQALRDALTRLPQVDRVQLDMEWVQRFSALMAIGHRGVLVMGGLLALAVLLIVGNTIRLEIQNRRAEIEVTKLVGATDAFIRRPFLYAGLWYGLLGAALAWLLILLAFAGLAGPTHHLATLYGSGFSLESLGFSDTLVLLATGGGLGLAGSWLAVGRHLRAIEPA